MGLFSTFKASVDIREKALEARPQRRRTKNTNTDEVEDSDDLQRILALPRRPRPDQAEQERMAAEMTARLRIDNPNCQCASLRPGVPNPCITKLNAVQGWYLYEAALAGGAIGHILVGGGKTGIDILLAMVMPNTKRVVLLLLPNLRKQFAMDYQVWSQHFRTPNLSGTAGPHHPDRPVIDVLSYSELSNPSCATWLASRNPCGVIGDEGQALKDKESVRTDRFLRFYIESRSDAWAAFHSGSLTTRSPDDYAHLSALALREGSPVPIEPKAVGEWCAALSPGPGGSDPILEPGELYQLCNPGESVRAGFHRRLSETLGVITTEDAALNVKLKIIRRDVDVPAVITSLMSWVRKEKMRPDREVLTEQVEIVSTCRELASGFFYVWKYPRGESADLIDRWFLKRQAYAAELRYKLEHRSNLLDSPALLSEAAARFHEGYEGDLPVWDSQHWAAWKEIEPQVVPEPATMWLDDFLAADAVSWAAEAPGIVWYQQAALGLRMAELSGLPHYGPGDSQPVNLNPTAEMLRRREVQVAADNWGGDTCENWIELEDGTRSIIASLKSHGTGRNLQYAFSRMLMTNSPSDSGIWEQGMGRAHRFGQLKDLVECFVYRHTPEVRKALDVAREFSAYVYETTRKAEKLVYAEYEGVGL